MTSQIPTPQVALQLYTVRALAARDPIGTFEQVAALGYDGVELAGLHGREAADVGDTCRRLDLAVCGAHVGIERFEADPDAVEAELRALGLDEIVFPSFPTPLSGRPEDAVARLRGATDEALDRGLQPVFHNHAAELRRNADGARVWEALLDLPGLQFELDLGWAWIAGEDPRMLLEGLAGRVPLVHVKDHVRNGSDCPVGDGEVGYESVVPVAVASGVPWLVVEQDEPGDQPLAAAGRSLAALREMLALPLSRA